MNRPATLVIVETVVAAGSDSQFLFNLSTTEQLVVSHPYEDMWAFYYGKTSDWTPQRSVAVDERHDGKAWRVYGSVVEDQPGGRPVSQHANLREAVSAALDLCLKAK